MVGTNTPAYSDPAQVVMKKKYNNDVKTRSSYRRGRHSTVDLLIKIVFCEKKENIVFLSKAADLTTLVQGGQLY